MKLIVANWKMNLTVAAAARLARELVRQSRRPTARVVLCPSFAALGAVRAVLRAPYQLGAQDMSADTAGAHTGQVSGAELHQLGCRFVLVGHSERRIELRETDAQVAAKLRAALAAKLQPILCVGETKAERRAHQTGTVITRQLRSALAKLPLSKKSSILIAYEPVWAIGSGKAATPAQASEAAALIRHVLGNLAKGTRVQVLYGGSVDAGNARAFLTTPGIDGLLVGGASTKLSFAKLIAVA